LRARTIALLAAAALGVSACGDSEDNAELPPAVPAGAAETTATETTTTTTGAPARVGGKLKISKDRSAKPAIPKPSGAPPTKLVIQDVVKGSGRAAKVDDQVTVHYVGVTHSTGEEFDASWNGGKPTQFALSKGQLINGWVEGIPGMKVGGRRVLIIPPELGYGAEGSPPSIGPNETLIFVIDLKKVG
jgi:peptidylprolyl isomerase